MWRTSSFHKELGRSCCRPGDVLGAGEQRGTRYVGGAQLETGMWTDRSLVGSLLGVYTEARLCLEASEAQCVAVWTLSWDFIFNPLGFHLACVWGVRWKVPSFKRISLRCRNHKFLLSTSVYWDLEQRRNERDSLCLWICHSLIDKTR